MTELETKGWICGTCGTYNDPANIECFCCDTPRPADFNKNRSDAAPENSDPYPEFISSDPDDSAKAKKVHSSERDRRISRALKIVLRVVLFLILIAAFVLAAYNIIQAEQQGSAAGIAAERILGLFSRLLEKGECIGERFTAAVSTVVNTFNILLERISSQAENIWSEWKPSFTGRISFLSSNFESVKRSAGTRIVSAAIFVRQNMFKAADRLSQLSARCIETVNGLYSLIRGEPAPPVGNPNNPFP